MANTILHKRSSTSGSAPAAGDLSLGELALNTADGSIYMKTSAGSVVQVGQNLASFNTDLIPSDTLTYNLGSPTKQWHSAYIGPGSLYVNGQKVLEEDAGTIVISADDDQNVQIRTGGGGDIEFYASGTGAIEMKSSISIQSGKNLLSNDGNPISCTVGFTMNGERINDLADPSSAQDAATKAYVDAQLSADLSSLITVTDGSNSTALGDGDTLTFSGTANEVTVSESAGTITVGLPATTVTAGSYGSSTAIPTFTVDANGRLTAAGTTAISSDMSIAGDSGTDTITVGTDTFTISGGTGLSTAATTDEITVNLDNTGVTAASYGSATAIPVLTINAQGQVTAASTASVSSDLPVAGDSGTGTISLLTETLTVAGGSNVTTSMSGNTLTVALDASPSITALTTSGDVTVGGSLNSDDITAATMTASGNVIVQGNLTVNGTTTTVNSNTVNIGDNMLVLNADETGTPSQNAGFEVERGTSTNVSFYWDEANDRFSTDGQNLAAGTFVGALSGNASTATKLATARTIGLSGDVSGSVSFDGSANATITATVADDSHNHVVGNIDGLAEYIADTAGAMWTGNSESYITVTYQDTDNTMDISHNNTTRTNTTSSASVAHSGSTTVVDSITTNAQGHITGVNTKTVTWPAGAVPNDGTLTMATSGTGLSGSATFTADDADNVTFTVTSNATSANTASTIVARDASGNFSAGVITGTATTARYADLAEMYAADGEIEPGTVVCFGGDAEVTTCMHDMDRKVAGVVSTNPAYLMNSEAEGVAVALQGRVPVKVTGPVAKGDMLVSAGNGMARAEENPAMGSVIGKALGNNEDGESIIEVVVGRL